MAIDQWRVMSNEKNGLFLVYYERVSFGLGENEWVMESKAG